MYHKEGYMQHGESISSQLTIMTKPEQQWHKCCWLVHMYVYWRGCEWAVFYVPTNTV